MPGGEASPPRPRDRWFADETYVKVGAHRVSDSEAVTRGPRQGRAYTLTLNGEPLARMIPIRRRRAIPTGEVFAIFATAPAADAGELRSDIDADIGDELRDPYDGTDR